MGLVGGHLAQDRSALLIRGRQPVEVVLEMRLDLMLRLGDEAEARGVAEAAGDEADAEAAGIPERAERARPPAELVEPFSAPDQMIPLLAGGGQQVVARRGRTCADGLARIKRLRG